MFPFPASRGEVLKAYIISKGLAFEKVHDLVHLLKTCSAAEPAFAILKEDCILLNTTYIETRYPVHWPYTKETAEQARIAAVNIAQMVRNQLECNGKPCGGLK